MLVFVMSIFSNKPKSNELYLLTSCIGGLPVHAIIFTDSPTMCRYNSNNARTYLVVPILSDFFLVYELFRMYRL